MVIALYKTPFNGGRSWAALECREQPRAEEDLLAQRRAQRTERDAGGVREWRSRRQPLDASRLRQHSDLKQQGEQA